MKKKNFPQSISKQYKNRKPLLILFFVWINIYSGYAWGVSEWSNSIAMANFILSLQNADGAIEDEPGGGIVNEDSNMEYALIALGATYNITGDTQYLDGLRKGIIWLAAREEMSDSTWNGSWMYAYDYNSPYNAIPTSPGDPSISDVRGVDATSTLFVYLLYLYQHLTGDDTLTVVYENNARAALDFVINHNLDSDGYSWSSWQKWVSDNQWHLWKFKYAADQGDVWLGLKAGALLYDLTLYGPYADFIENNAPAHFFDVSEGRFCLGIDDAGVKDWSIDGFDGIFPNGYLPWLWCSTPETEAAYNWLQSYVHTDGSIQVNSGDAYAASVALYGLATFSLNHPQPTQSFLWLNKTPTNGGPYDDTNGGVHDTPNWNESEYDNIAGFSAMAMMGWTPGLSCMSSQILTTEQDSLMEFGPNPVADKLEIMLYVTHPCKISISVTDMLGKKIINENDVVSTQGYKSYSYNLQSVKSGVYLLSIVGVNNKVVSKKIIKL